jgi:nitroreductase
VDAYAAIITKQDSRAFDARAVPESVTRRILQAGRMAGSSKNTQPCRFVILQDAARRSALASCGAFAKHMLDAPLCIAVVLTPGGGSFDAGRAAQNMMVAGWAEGVTSCPTSMHNAACAEQTLGPLAFRPSITSPSCWRWATPSPARRAHHAGGCRWRKWRTGRSGRARSINLQERGPHRDWGYGLWELFPLNLDLMVC